MIDSYQFETKRFMISVQDIVRYINKGIELMKLELLEDEVFDDLKQIEYYNAIILSPQYQRKYRSNSSDASSVIESILKNIPLPEIFLVSDEYNGTPMRNVMDGQHRLTSVYHFVTNKYRLVSDDRNLNKKYFSELDKAEKLKILNYPIAVLEFQQILDSDVEIELFQIYNSKQKVLTDQELHSSRYVSSMLDWVESLVKTVYESQETQDVDLKSAFNMTTDRVVKQKVNQDILAILWVLENGTQTYFQASTKAALLVMERYNKLYLTKQNEELEELKIKFTSYMEFIKFFTNKNIVHPISSQIIGEDNYKNYKFNVGISLIYAYVLFNYKIEYNDNLLEEISNLVKYARDEERLSSTSCANSKSLERIVSEYIEKNNLQCILAK